MSAEVLAANEAFEDLASWQAQLPRCRWLPILGRRTLRLEPPRVSVRVPNDSYPSVTANADIANRLDDWERAHVARAKPSRVQILRRAADRTRWLGPAGRNERRATTQSHPDGYGEIRGIESQQSARTPRAVFTPFGRDRRVRALRACRARRAAMAPSVIRPGAFGT